MGEINQRMAARRTLVFVKQEVSEEVEGRGVTGPCEKMGDKKTLPENGC